MADSERAKLVALIQDVFRRHGYEGTSLTAISQATGLGRGSLYHHFPGGKAEMAAAALDDVARAVESHFVAALDERTVPPGEGLARAQKLLDDYFDCGLTGCLCAVLTLTAPEFRGRAHAILDEWIAAFARLAVSAGMPADIARQKAETAVGMVEGALILSIARQDKGPFARAVAVLPDLLLPQEARFKS
jgi:AcrR family transcriptional regulator